VRGSLETSRIDGVMQPRQDYCSTCLTNPVRKENGCCNHVPSGGKIPRKTAQWSPHGQCADHVRTSTSVFDWTVCENSSIGCTQLSMQHGKGSCYSCSQNHKPCAREVPVSTVGASSSSPSSSIQHAMVAGPTSSSHPSASGGIAFKPEEKCSNYPVCKSNRLRPRVNGVQQPRAEYCSTCSANPICKEDACCRHVATGGKVPRKKPMWKPNGRCAEHMRTVDKSSSCEWGACSNVTAGCKQLSVEFSTGMCYLSCPRHVAMSCLLSLFVDV